MVKRKEPPNLFLRVVFISISMMFVISSTSLLHANEAEFILDRFSGITTVQLSFFDTILYLAYLIAGPVVGFLSARTGKRRLFVVTGAAGAALFTFAMTLTLNYTVLLVFRFLEGLFCVTSWQSLMTMILDLSDDDNRGRNMGIFGTFMALSMALGPMVGGLLSGISLFIPYYASAGQCIIALLIISLFVREPIVKNSSRKPGILDSFAFAGRKPAVFAPALFNLVDRLHMSFIIFMVPLMLRQILNLGPEYRGMMLGINGAAYILLQYPVGRLSDRIGRFRLLFAGSIGYGVLMCFTGPAASAGLPALIGLFFCLGIFSGLTGPPNSALLGDVVSKKDNPLAMGFFNLFGNIGMVCGSIFGGVMLSFSGFTAAFIGAAAIELATLAINVFIIRKFAEGDLKFRKKGELLV